MPNGIAEGRVLAGKYRVERVLGQGGMGVVVAAHHIHLDERVAIKFLLPDAVANAEVVGRFVREARAAVRIKSEHVARVSDVGTLEGGEPYMVMEYLEGSDLAAWLLQRGALPVEQAVEFLLQASEAIAEAHALGIVHRDLKPANLFVVRRADGLWSVKVLDFGISKVTALDASGPDSSLTRTNAVMGSPVYMPPEQMAASKNVDGRADIWALGVILYELLCARAPFAGETLPEVCMKIATEPPPAIRSLRPDLPPALEAVILRCLAKDREQRYRNVAELAHALVDFGPKRAKHSVERITRTIQAAGLSASALALPPSSDRDRGGAAPAISARAGNGTEAPWGRTTEVPRKGKRSALLLGTLALVSVAGLAVGLTRRSPPLSSADAAGGVGLAPLRAQASATATAQLAVAPSTTTSSVEGAPSPAGVPPPSAAAGVAAVGVAAASKAAPSKAPGRAAPIHPIKHSAPGTTSSAAVAAAATPTPAARPAQKPDIFDDR
jgi:serine/threonine-protein kinase